MLFENDEFDGCQPVFSEPKKVLPDTEDEITRRIKIMLGEYAQEEIQNPSVSNTSDVKDSSSNCQLNSEATNRSPLEANALQVTCKNNEEVTDDRNFETSEFSNVENDVDKQREEKSEKITCEEPSAISVRRSSLKRQCKDKICLLDYNPMFTIRNKRTKPNNLMKSLDKSKSSKSSEVSDDGNSSYSDKFNSFQDSKNPSMLDPLQKTSTEASYENIKDLKSAVDASKYCNTSGTFFKENKQCWDGMLFLDCKPFEDSINTKLKKDGFVKSKSKKQSKKKKKKSDLETVPAGNVISHEVKSIEGLNQSEAEQSSGPCQIKNGCIKIRLSKLTDNQKVVGDNDYEVSLSESDALISCKSLSVPLSPLAPAIYTTYCESLNNKISRSKRPKSRDKKPAEKIDMPRCKTPSKVSVKKIEETASKNLDLELNYCNQEKMKLETLEGTDSSSEAKNIVQDKLSCDETVTVSETFLHLTDKNCPSKSLNEANPQNSCLEKYVNICSLSPSHSFITPNPTSGVLCSIDLTLLARVPPNPYFMSGSPKERCVDTMPESNAKNKFLSNANENDFKSSSEECFESRKRPYIIKKERCTPPMYDYIEPMLRRDEDIQSPVRSINDLRNDEACPNLIPAYSFNVSHPLNKFPESENLANDHHVSKFSALCNDVVPVMQKNVCDRIEYSMFVPNPKHNSIKHESPDKLTMHNKKWKEVDDFKWCHDFPDLNYSSKSLFKDCIPYNVVNPRIWQDPELKKQYSSEYYLNEAKKLKHQADKEIDRMVQAMKYLEAVLYFILTGNAMEHSYIDTDRVHTMYKETLALIRFISSKFQKLRNSSCRNIDNKLTVLSLRCQSLLYLKMYQLRRDEVRLLHKSISSFLKAEHGTVSGQDSPVYYQYLRQHLKNSQVSPSHQASPCSLVPSPAESIASAGSQSSGYGSCELGWPTSSAFSYSRPYDVCSDVITITRTKYKMLEQQSLYLSNLHLSHDLWEHADYLSSKEHSREFFMELDEECGCLSLHSPFSALVHYVRKGLYKLKDGT